MIELIWDQKFKKTLKKRLSKSDELTDKFNSKIKLFEEDPFNPILRTHKLSGILKEYWAFSIDYNLRVIFKFIDSNTALLIDIGTHDEVY
jgi:addiction module RelE/StbE family toxin